LAKRNCSAHDPPVGPQLADNGEGVTLKTERHISRKIRDAQEPATIRRLAGRFEQLIAVFPVLFARVPGCLRGRLAKVIPQ